ncbi:glutaredoxin family protein [Billgrantia kenyensis]|uniref:Glutaredoxin family protein n=1 Tax=Billgrantia kenyensis TaxID=321266 RepID=A0A7V9W1T9_9GAMM|nr:glutaredoxin family protein [Halomonas kenyensis]MBA2779462.1 glutaredoxin family protein [Halomonas kenyensis]MCG6662695.1 glutaredoxin family protein [Halomonas kenyensis]
MNHLTLYTTLGCHLCEQLEALLAQLHRGAYRLEKVEISESEELMARYGVRIPVLTDAAGEELDMGFEPPRLAAWLEARGWLDSAAWQRLQSGESTEDQEEQVSRIAPARPGGRRYLG